MYCISWQSRNVACVVHFVCGLFVILNLAYEVVKKKHVFSFFTACHCYNVISVSCLAVISFSPTHFAVYKIWIGCMLLRTYSYA